MNINKWLGCLALGGLFLGTADAVNNTITVQAKAPEAIEIDFDAASGNGALKLIEDNGTDPTEIPAVVSKENNALAPALRVRVSSAHSDGTKFRLENNADNTDLCEYTVKVGRTQEQARTATKPAEHNVPVELAADGTNKTVAIAAYITPEQKNSLARGATYQDELTVDVVAQ